MKGTTSCFYFTQGNRGKEKSSIGGKTSNTSPSPPRYKNIAYRPNRSVCPNCKHVNEEKCEFRLTVSENENLEQNMGTMGIDSQSSSQKPLLQEPPPNIYNPIQQWKTPDAERQYSENVDLDEYTSYLREESHNPKSSAPQERNKSYNMQENKKINYQNIGIKYEDLHRNERIHRSIHNTSQNSNNMNKIRVPMIEGFGKILQQAPKTMTVDNNCNLEDNYPTFEIRPRMNDVNKAGELQIENTFNISINLGVDTKYIYIYIYISNRSKKQDITNNSRVRYTKQNLNKTMDPSPIYTTGTRSPLDLSMQTEYIPTSTTYYNSPTIMKNKHTNLKYTIDNMIKNNQDLTKKLTAQTAQKAETLQEINKLRENFAELDKINRLVFL